MERHANIQSGDEVCSVRTFRGVTDRIPSPWGEAGWSRLSVTSFANICRESGLTWMCLGFALLLLSRTAAMAWGPHPAITQAALDALGTNHPLKLLLGEHARR